MIEKQPQRRGVTLLELLAVVVLLGILTTIAIARLGDGGLGNFGSQADGRRLAIAFRQAKRAAISTGDNHYLLFTLVDGKAVVYRLYRRASGGDVTADAYWTFSERFTVTPSATEAEFNFEGQALAAYTVTLAGPDRSWSLAVVPSTGSVRMSEL